MFKNKLWRTGLAMLFANVFAVSASHSWWIFSSNNQAEYTKTQYPIVLIPGLVGFDNALNLVLYWPDVVAEIERSGGKAYVLETNMLGSSYQRGETVIKQLEELKATYGHQRFNLVGHSNGGLDSRYVAGVRPDLAASVTTLGSPSEPELITTAPLILNKPETVKVINFLGRTLAWLSTNNYSVDSESAFSFFTKEGLTKFNQQFPQALPTSFCGEGANIEFIDGHAVRYYSWMGNKVVSNWLDPGELMHIVVGKTVEGPDDGFVNQCGAHFGSVIRDNYQLNHMDYANLFFGLTNPWETSPKTLIRTHANRLKNAGL